MILNDINKVHLDVGGSKKNFKKTVYTIDYPFIAECSSKSDHPIIKSQDTMCRGEVIAYAAGRKTDLPVNRAAHQRCP